MSVALCLLLYGFAVAVLAPRLLRRLSIEGTAPRIAIAAWLAAMASTVLAWTVTLAILLIDIATHQISLFPVRFMDGCLLHLHDAAVGDYGHPVQTGLLALSGFATLAGILVAYRLATTLLRSRRRTLEHARMARLAGRHHPDLDAVVLDVDHPAAYCVAGKPHTIVLSRGVLTALEDHHLDAVLAHERAHLDGRHHLLLTLTRGLASVLPRLDLFTVGAAEVARLLEMLADDAAARKHGPDTVLQALLTLSALPSPPATAQAALLPRVRRLSAPTTPPRWYARAMATAVALLAVSIPVAAIITAGIGIRVCAV
ncbi:M56 family metallopeptidase [Nocardia sp. CDC160]|uniref:M56 family metallopeptidase n=1 Tax=Nocardia sp. CDC160 TaxID=3112166 RepID=UPI002DB58FBB|nr:M56 family metallopeptidase [Nocardia sp. CDC160]MEC3918070.1 M56 family metallopeptidase [Nocardia sp. CDC160]